jgi:hypothetical protein
MLKPEERQRDKRKSPRLALDLLLNSASQTLPEIQPMHHHPRLEALCTNAQSV